MNAWLELITDTAMLTEQELGSIPAWWTELAGLEGAAAVQRTVQQWNTDLNPPLLPGFVQVLADRGIDVALVWADSAEHTGLALLYALEYPSVSVRYICGLPPVATVSAPAAALPADFARFYTTMHAGMYFELHVPHAVIKPTDLGNWCWREVYPEDELAFIDKPPAVQPNPDTLYVVYNDYGGAMILADTAPTTTAVWATEVGMLNDQSYRLTSTWELLDDWIAGYFTP